MPDRLTMHKACGVGIDIVEVARIAALLKKGNSHLLHKFFTKREVAYCTAFASRAEHFAGTLAAKEAVSKALGTVKYPFIEVEIRRRTDGTPEAWHKGKRLRIRISITHAGAYAAAVAVV